MTRRPPVQELNPSGAALGLFGIAFVVWRWVMVAVLLLLRCLWRTWLWWLHQLGAAQGRNPELARRPRPWIILGSLAVPMVATLVVSPALAAKVGWIPVVGSILLGASVITLRRRTRVRQAARRARNQPPAPTWQQADVTHYGQWASSPRTAALERLVGELIINLGDIGLSVSDAIAAVSHCSVMSRSLLLAGVEANLTALASLEHQQGADVGLSPIGEAAIPWLYEFQSRLRPLVGSGLGHVPDVVDQRRRPTR